VKLDVAFTPAEIGGHAGDRTVVVIDVLRASSTIVEALVNGAHAVIPVESVEIAVARAHEIGRDQCILCGERDTQPIAGFQLGNSPLEFTAQRVAGKTLVMTTTNGTRTLAVGGTGSRCLVGSLLNAGAVAQMIRDDGDVLLLCAGREGRFALEDALCAGIIARRVLAGQRRADSQLNDAAMTAMLLARRFEKRLPEAILRTAAGRRLAELGRGEDVEYCVRADHHDRVPIVRERRVTL
jgi:2-phosphosulfolactate phosphatase